MPHYITDTSFSGLSNRAIAHRGHRRSSGSGADGAVRDTVVGFDSSDFSTARYVYAGTVADSDNDGDPDVATAPRQKTPRITVLLNNGDSECDLADFAVFQKSFTGGV